MLTQENVKVEKDGTHFNFRGYWKDLSWVFLVIHFQFVDGHPGFSQSMCCVVVLSKPGIVEFNLFL